MSNMEMKINAMCAVLTAETFEERDKAMHDLKCAMQQKQHSVEEIVRDLFLEIGVPENLIGYEYAISAVKKAVEDVSYINNITFGLYPAIAADFSTTPSRAERAIRNLVEKTFDRQNGKMTEYFGDYINVKSGKVCNSEFISRMANICKKKMREM